MSDFVVRPPQYEIDEILETGFLKGVLHRQFFNYYREKEGLPKFSVGDGYTTSTTEWFSLIKWYCDMVKKYETPEGGEWVNTVSHKVIYEPEKIPYSAMRSYPYGLS